MPRLSSLLRHADQALGFLQRFGITRLTIVVGALLVILLGAWGFRETSTPQFCRSCHEMGYYYNTWHSSSHHELNCEECHLGANVKDMIVTKIGAAREILVHAAKKPQAAEVPRRAEIADEVCRKCHEPPAGEFRYHLLRMTHQNHLDRGMHCTDCHRNVVHGGRTGFKNTPPMAGCLTCHNGDKAPNNCSLCHLKLGEMKPPVYNPAWVQQHRENLKSTGRDRCQTCHGEEFCRSCHQTVPPHGSDWLVQHRKTTKAQLPDCAACHQPRTGEEMALFCIDCHNARRAHGPNYVLTHPQDFQQRSESCRLCHDQNFCASCHQIYRPHPLDWVSKHGQAVHSGSKNCATCHPNRFCQECHSKGRPASHTKDWRQKHGEAARTGQEACKTCHTPQMCRQCHATQPPASHRGGAWLQRHGPEAMVEKSFCTICHDQQTCTECHGVQMPHAADWRKVHSQQSAARNRQACLKCHKVEFCNTCHRGSMPPSHQTNWLQRHGRESLQTQAKCSLCHDGRLCNACHALPMPHPAGWGKGAHRIPAQQRPEKCATCHQPGDCLRCHGKRPPASHRQRDFDRQHATQGVDGALCGLCHGADSCRRCHQGLAMPHSAEFRAGEHGKIAERTPQACAKCHGSPKVCLACHGSLPPAFHSDKTFRSGHGSGQKQLCVLCHGKDACVSCHASLKKSPHADDFAMTHKAKAKFTKDASCFLCHKVGYCQQCHPDAVLK
jgi:nitrate/TMAO reductase-like tetraheme cytochrome c subunit